MHRLWVEAPSLQMLSVSHAHGGRDGGEETKNGRVGVMKETKEGGKKETKRKYQREGKTKEEEEHIRVGGKQREGGKQR